MANFEVAYKRTEKFEGKNVYTKTPGDAGGLNLNLAKP